MDILTNLNPAQREAVETINGPVLILAGPGSGKTRVITHRIAYLIKVCGINPHYIMAVTFTNKAAKEMRERLQQLIGRAAEYLTLGTFHAICARFLRRDGHTVGIDPHFVIYDDDDQVKLIKRSMQELNLDPKQYAPQAITSAISAAKTHMVTAGDYVQQSRSYFEEVIGRVYEHYQQSLESSKALDFDDLLMKAVLLLRENHDTLSTYETRYRHILVDEFQDTNLVQYELVKQLGNKYRNICVVGDPDQSIYSWRFADLRNILSFEKDYPETKLVLLEENYRSTKQILETASHVISANEQRKAKNLWTSNESGEPVSIIETYTEQEEAQFVVSEVERLVAQGQFSMGDCAIMYRTNAQSRPLEEAFIRYGTPYKLVAGTRFYERREVKDIIAYLRIILNPTDHISLLRIINVPQRGIGEQTQSRLSNWAKSIGTSPYEALQLIDRPERQEAVNQLFTSRLSRALTDFGNLINDLINHSQQLNLVELFDLVVERSGYKKYILNEVDGEERWDNIMELRTVAQEYGDLKPRDGLAAFLEGVALVSDVDGFDETISATTLITLHQAKGLEFPVVFIVGMEEGLLPHFRSMDDPEQMEEERRLCYVGITRAKQLVYLIRSFRRSLMGRSAITEPSRFLKDIPQNHIATGTRWQGEESPLGLSPYSWESRSPVVRPFTAEFKPGDHVHHAQFGPGVVVSYQPIKDDAEAVVAFNGTVKKLLISLAHLEKMD